MKPIALVAMFMMSSAAMSAACPMGPNLYTGRSLVGEFYDCGEFTYLRTPSPTDTRHAIVDPRTNTLSVCVMPGSFKKWRFPNLPNIEVAGRDRRILFNENVYGQVVVSGQRIEMVTLPGRFVAGVTCAVGSENVSLNGECVCGGAQ